MKTGKINRKTEKGVEKAVRGEQNAPFFRKWNCFFRKTWYLLR